MPTDPFDIDTLFSEEDITGDEPGETSKVFNNKVLIHDAAYALLDHPKPEAIIGDFILRKSVNVLVGESGDGKSWILLDLGVMVADGRKFLGFPTVQCRVGYFDQDMGDEFLTERVGQVLRGEEATAATPFLYCSMPNLNLSEPAHALILQTWIEEYHLELVFLDALIDFLGTVEENSATEMNPIFSNLRNIADKTGAAFVIAHHLNRAGAYRGSSAIKGKVDTMFELSRKEDSNLFTIKTAKARHGKKTTFSGAMIWEDDKFYMGQVIIQEEMHMSKAQQLAYDFFEKDGTLSGLVDHAGELYTTGTLKTATAELIRRKLLTRKNNGGKGTEAIYGRNGHTPEANEGEDF
jgi:hypothetical protein